MIRCCSKFLISLPPRSGSPVCLGRFYVASRDNTQKRHASGEGQAPPRRFRKLFYSTVGVTLLGVGGIVVYAKSDPKFRRVLDSYVPGSDKVISVIYQEGDTWNIQLSIQQLKQLYEKTLSYPVELYKQITGEEVKPTLTSTTKEFKTDEPAKPKPKRLSEESRPVPGLSEKGELGLAVPGLPEINTLPGLTKEVRRPAVVETGKKRTPLVAVPVSNDAVVAQYKSLADEAQKLFEKGISLTEESGKEIIDLIDKSIENNDQKTWKEIQEKVEENKKKLREVEDIQKEATEKLKKFSAYSNEKSLPEETVENLKDIEKSAKKAQARLEELKNSRLGASNKYFNKVEESRKHFLEELTTLFPGIRIGDRQLNLKENELDLFFYYASQKLLYYQKELDKLETVTSNKIKKAMADSKDSDAIKAVIDTEVDKEKRRIKEEFDKKLLAMKDECDKDVHNQLKRQEQVHLDLLSDQLKLKEQEVERKLVRQLEARVLEEETRLQAELADMTGRMQGLNEAIAKRALQDQKAQTSQALWAAAEALYSSLKFDEDGEKLKPLSPKVDAIKNAAAKGDDLVETVVATIPSVALKRGVYPEDVLRKRFLKLEGVAWRVAGVPDGGASLPVVLLSWLQSALIIKASEPIPASELNNEPINPDEFTNYDILQRARYWVDRGDFEQALKYMNLLKGGARSISLDWIKEVTLNLEAQQAANLLLAHAAASGMVYS